MNDKGTFEYEGGDMVYDVDWVAEDDAVYCEVFILIDGKRVNVTDNVYQPLIDDICATAHDYRDGEY